MAGPSKSLAMVIVGTVMTGVADSRCSSVSYCGSPLARLSRPRELSLIGQSYLLGRRAKQAER